MPECPWCDGEVFKDLQSLVWHLYEARHLPPMSHDRNGKPRWKSVQGERGYVRCFCKKGFWLGPHKGGLEKYTLAFHLEEKGGLVKHLLECKLGVES